MHGSLEALLMTLSMAIAPAGDTLQEIPSHLACPQEDSSIRWQIEYFLSEDIGLVATGLKHVDPLHLALVRDGEICKHLQDRIPAAYNVVGPDAEWEAAYYQIDDRYLVVLRYKSPEVDPDTLPPSTVVIGSPEWLPLIVYDEDLTLLHKGAI